ncbi:hypothetical protein [Hymenobacter saemangeumensis]
MAAIAADPKSAAKPEKISDLPAADWVFRGTPPKSREIQWTSSASSANSEGNFVPAVFVLRPFQQSYDAVLKTTENSCIRDLRSELKSQKLEPVPVTCPNCEAVRYDGPTYQTTIYSKMKGEFPYIVVVHPTQSMPATITKDARSSSAQ